MERRLVKLGTRRSALALWQAHHVKAALESAGHPVEIVEMQTRGDRILDTPLAEIGDKGLFTQELDAALLAGQIHLAVHSLKDLQTTLPQGLTLGAVSKRAAPWDAFVAHPSFAGELQDLPDGAVLATSSLRRSAQLQAWRPDLEIVPVRGNVDTRLGKLDASVWHGVILAEAGLYRLGRAGRIRQRIPLEIMIPAVSQGALGVVCAETDPDTRATLREVIHHAPTAAATAAERAFLRRLEGGCQAPIGAHARYEEGRMTLDGVVASLDGQTRIRGRRRGDPADPEGLGLALAGELLGRGAQGVLDEIRHAT